MLMDRRTDMTKLIVALRNIVNAPKTVHMHLIYGDKFVKMTKSIALLLVSLKPLLKFARHSV
jgi:hypothetical protein